jgi:6,7-dimethyl-8-ribityllumazine synthase
VSDGKPIEGAHEAAGRRVAIVAARFNEFIVDRLLDGAVGVWRARGGDPARLTIARVPGAFELPVTARRLAMTARYDAVVALGCVIRGETPHFDYVAGECARGLQLTALETGVPVAFGVLTVDNVEHALARASEGGDNKGSEAMETALEMADLFSRLPAA